VQIGSAVSANELYPSVESKPRDIVGERLSDNGRATALHQMNFYGLLHNSTSALYGIIVYQLLQEIVSIFANLKCFVSRYFSFLVFTRNSSVSSIVILSVCLSVTRVNRSKTVQARITKSSPSAARKTLVLGTVKLFHKFEGNDPKRGR